MKTKDRKKAHAPAFGAKLSRSFASGHYIITESHVRAGGAKGKQKGKDSESKDAVKDNQIWIRHTGNPKADLVNLPYSLLPGDQIVCFAPETKKSKKKSGNKDDPEPTIDYFCVDYVDPGSGEYVEEVIEYDYQADCLEVDLSVLDQFEEFYEPEPEAVPYECTDENGDGIGIEG